MNNSVDDHTPLCDVLKRLRQRQRVLGSFRGAARGLFLGSMLSLLLGVAAWLGIVAADLFSFPLVLISALAAALLGLLIGTVTRVDDLEVSRALDRAAGSQDRFASAVQLKDHHRRGRARLVTVDALAKVGAVPAASALPLRVPREIKWLPIPLLVLAGLLWLGPGVRTQADVLSAPEITDEQWDQVNEELRRKLDELLDPKDPDEEETDEELLRLASFLKTHPTKKDALAEIAKLREELEQRRKSLGANNLNLRRSAKAVRSSSTLSKFGARLRGGNYKKAAEELKALARRLRENAERMAATDFEAAASDFDALATELASHEDLAHACRKCANAASSMNSDQLADALDRFSKRLAQSSEQLKRSDKLCRSCDMLDDLKSRLNRYKKCSSCKSGSCQGRCNGSGGFVRRNNKKGGLKAGWGTADQWNGGLTDARSEQRMPTLANTREQGGRSTSFSVVSRDERARSAIKNRELYTDMVQKVEDDLSLESVPLAYRDYLRRYFTAIRPPDEVGESADD